MIGLDLCHTPGIVAESERTHMYDVGPIFDHLDEIEKYLEQARLELAAGQTINAIMAIQGIAQNTAVAQTRALGNLCRIMVDQGLGS